MEQGFHSKNTTEKQAKNNRPANPVKARTCGTVSVNAKDTHSMVPMPLTFFFNFI